MKGSASKRGFIMPKAYAVVHIDIHDNDAYDQYKVIASEAVAEAGGVFLVRGGAQIVKEGQPRARTVLVEFPSVDAAEKFYHGDKYQEALSYALPDASSREYLIVEGA